MTYSQNQASNWYFGHYAGITFNSETPPPPVALTGGAMSTQEGCCTISDMNGNLLFYSDGITVWNKNHAVMLNGNGLAGHNSSTQSSIVVPKPGSNRYYYIFTVPDCFATTGGLCYTTIDMTLDGGLGGVVTTEKNVLLQSYVTEKVTAVKHSNNSDIWIITHERNNAVFDVFLITSGGVNPTSIKSTIGSNHEPVGSYLGYLKASPDGRHLACAVYQPGNFAEIFDLNTTTGAITSPVKITQDLESTYGIEYSPNSRFVYIGCFNNGKVFQVDLSSDDSATIAASSVLVATIGTSLGALQLGPDNVLYMSKASSYYLSAYLFPNLPGPNPYTIDAVYLGGQLTMLGLPTFIQSYFNPVPFTYSNTCLGDTTLFIPEQTLGIDSVHWDFGDPASNPYNTSGLIQPSHIFTSTGTFNVSLTSWASGISATETETVKITASPEPFLGADTVLCGDNSLVLTPGDIYESYLWNNGSIDPTLLVTASGTYSVWVTDGNGCQGVDAIEVLFYPKPGPRLIKHD